MNEVSALCSEYNKYANVGTKCKLFEDVTLCLDIHGILKNMNETIRCLTEIKSYSSTFP